MLHNSRIYPVGKTSCVIKNLAIKNEVYLLLIFIKGKEGKQDFYTLSWFTFINNFCTFFSSYKNLMETPLHNSNQKPVMFSFAVLKRN